jgi:hypothetical protein
MKRPLIFTSLLLAGVAAFLLGSAYGFKKGAENHAYLDLLAKGVISTYRYSRLEAGEIDHIKDDLNMDVDVAIDMYAQYQNEGNHLYSELFLPEYTERAEPYMQRLASFRNSVPEKEIGHLLTGSDQAEYSRIANKRRAFLAKYSVKETP